MEGAFGKVSETSWSSCKSCMALAGLRDRALTFKSTQRASSPIAGIIGPYPALSCPDLSLSCSACCPCRCIRTDLERGVRLRTQVKRVPSLSRFSLKDDLWPVLGRLSNRSTTTDAIYIYIYIALYVLFTSLSRLTRLEKGQSKLIKIY